MTFREKLADWISGGKLSEFLTLAAENKQMWQKSKKTIEKCEERSIALINIHAYTSPQKSGTAKKVARMCEEALK